MSDEDIDGLNTKFGEIIEKLTDIAGENNDFLDLIQKDLTDIEKYIKKLSTSKEDLEEKIVELTELNEKYIKDADALKTASVTDGDKDTLNAKIKKLEYIIQQNNLKINKMKTYISDSETKLERIEEILDTFKSKTDVLRILKSIKELFPVSSSSNGLLSYDGTTEARIINSNLRNKQKRLATLSLPPASQSDKSYYGNLFGDIEMTNTSKPSSGNPSSGGRRNRTRRPQRRNIKSNKKRGKNIYRKHIISRRHKKQTYTRGVKRFRRNRTRRY